MRIAIDANVLDSEWGGIPKNLSRIADELVRGGDEVHLLANTRRLHHRVEGAHEPGIKVKGIALWRQAFLPLWLARSEADVLWAPESVLPRRSPVPGVVTIHDLAALRLTGVKPARHERQFGGAVARSAQRAARVIAVSQTTADDVKDSFAIDPAKLRVVPNGVDASFSPGNREAALAAVRDRWGVEPPFVLHVGRLEPRKGLDVLIDAAASASQDGAPWKAVLAGLPGYEGERIEAAARASGGCILLGGVGDAELVELMRAASAFAAPALYEGFGIAPLEAMACGTPAVIAAGSGGLEETSAAAAIVVAERSTAAWREALERALARPEALVERGLAHAARFRWPQVAAQTRAVLAEAACGEPSTRVGSSEPAP